MRTQTQFAAVILMTSALSAGASDEPTPLEKYDYRDLMLVSVEDVNGAPTACLEDRKGVRYRIHSGATVGPNQGQVTKVESWGITVTENLELNMGDYYVHTFAWPIVRDEKLRHKCSAP